MIMTQQQLAENTNFVDIGTLPSYSEPYTEKKTFVRPMSVLDLRQVSKARALNDYDYMLRMLNACTSRTVSPTDCHDNLTIGDFYFLLMWEKLNSTPKAPYTVDWTCQAEVRVLSSGERLPNDGTVPDCGQHTTAVCDAQMSEIVHFSDIEIISLEPEKFFGLPSAVGEVEFDFPRVNVLTALREAMLDPELEYIARAAQWVKGGSLADKIALLERQPNLDAFYTCQVLEKTVVHGIAESCVLTCRVCLKKYAHTFKTDPMSFFL